MPNYGVTCPVCRYSSHSAWLSYHCPNPSCGALHEKLYRKEHPDPARGREMTRAEIEAEIAAAVRAGFYALPEVAA